MEYLRKEDILLINRMTIDRHGGNFVPPLNLLNPDPLEYLIEAVKAEMFGQELYPEVHDKAGLYMFNIISNHVFQDGNKRTGLATALLFIKLNKFRLKENLSKVKLGEKRVPNTGETTNEILFQFTTEVASGKLSLEECQAWFKTNMESRKVSE
jgi:death-on-curing protein